MDIYTHVSNPLAYVDPGLYWGMGYAFWQMLKNLLMFGSLAMGGAVLAAMGRRYSSIAEQEGEWR